MHVYETADLFVWCILSMSYFFFNLCDRSSSLRSIGCVSVCVCVCVIYMCDTTDSCVRYDRFIWVIESPYDLFTIVTRPLYCLELCALVVCVMFVSCILSITYSFVWQVLFIAQIACVWVCVIYMCDIPHACVRYGRFMCVMYSLCDLFILVTGPFHCSELCVCVRERECDSNELIHVCDMADLFVWCILSIQHTHWCNRPSSLLRIVCVWMCVVCMCDMPHSWVRYGRFICVMYSFYEIFICVTGPLHCSELRVCGCVCVSFTCVT